MIRGVGKRGDDVTVQCSQVLALLDLFLGELTSRVDLRRRVESSSVIGESESVSRLVLDASGARTQLPLHLRVTILYPTSGHLGPFLYFPGKLLRCLPCP